MTYYIIARVAIGILEASLVSRLLGSSNKRPGHLLHYYWGCKHCFGYTPRKHIKQPVRIVHLNFPFLQKWVWLARLPEERHNEEPVQQTQNYIMYIYSFQVSNCIHQLALQKVIYLLSCL